MKNQTMRVKDCVNCGKPMHKDRGVCPECGHMTKWFRIRLVVGCASILLAGIGIAIMLVMQLIAK